MPDLIELKSTHVSVWGMNYFPPSNHFLQRKVCCLCRYFHSVSNVEVYFLVPQALTVTTGTHHAMDTRVNHVHSFLIIWFHWESFIPRTVALWNRLFRGCFHKGYKRDLFMSCVNPRHSCITLWTFFLHLYQTTNYLYLECLLGFVLSEHRIHKRTL